MFEDSKDDNIEEKSPFDVGIEIFANSNIRPLQHFSVVPNNTKTNICWE